MSRLFSTLCLLGLAVCAAWAGVANPARQAARSAGTARVVRLHVAPDVAPGRGSPDGIDRARARLAGRGQSLDLVLWPASGDEIVGAATDAAMAALEAEGVRVESLFDTIAAYQAARRAGDPRALALQQPQAPAQSLRVVIIDLERSRRGVWLGDPELVLRRNKRFAAVLDAGAVADPGTDLVERYTRRGLVPAETLSVEEFGRVSTGYFPEDPYVAPEPDAVQKAEEGAYTSYEELTAGLQSLAGQYPDLVRVSSIGQSYEGRELWAVKVSSSAGVDDPAKPDVLVTGCYHAREWIAVEVPYALALRLPALYASDPRVRFLLDTTEVWVVPLVNPDGHAFSQTAPNHATGGVRLWRKNRRPVDLDGDGRPEGVGVDLNRNHGHVWRLAGDAPYPETSDDAGASDDPANFNVYRGPRPDSELEVQSLNRLTGDPTHEFAARLDYHNFSQLILYPLGHAPGPAVDDLLLSSLAHQMQTEIRLAREVTYTVKPSFDLYLTTGSSTDYAYGHDRQLAYTIELSPRSGGFDLDESEIPAVVDENVPAALLLVEWAAGPATVTSVRATQAGTAVTSLEWEREGAARVLAADTRHALRPGTLSVEVTFSRPLSGAPRLTIQAGDTTLAPPVQPGEPARYPGDTWIAVVDVPAVTGLDFARLGVEPGPGSAGVAGFDADPSTVAAYGIGTGRWRGFETNAPDASYVLGLSPDEDLPPAVGLLAPGTVAPAADGLPSEVFLAGTEVLVSWQARDDRGIVEQRLEYSTDGGATFEPVGGARLDPPQREYAWRTPARLSSATVVLRLTAIDGTGNQTRAVTAQPIAISRLAVTRAPVYARDRLRATVSRGALERVSHVQAAIDGVPIPDSRVGWRRDRNRVMLRGTLGELGLEAGRASQLRLVADGVPAPVVEFTP